MKTKSPVSTKKQSVTLKDLTTKKNPKGGASLAPQLDKTGKGITLSGGGGDDSLTGSRRKG